MAKKLIVVAVLAAVAGAALLLIRGPKAVEQQSRRAGFVQVRDGRFVVDDRPFNFVGANVAVMFRHEDREKMPETMRQAAAAGMKVVRVWAFGEGGPDDIKPIADFSDWPRTFFFRKSPGHWNENAFVELDRTLAEASRNNLRVQLCLTNWWRDTGGVTQYLRWAGINDAADDTKPFGINNDRAMLFYTNEITRRLYKEHLEKIATRRNTVTGQLYRDDPTILGYELMNEAQSVTLRWPERRAWMAEMSAYLKSLDPDHLIAPGDWGYRSAAERREWLADHSLPQIDYCDVHNYPPNDHDLFVDSPQALRDFIRNRVAASYAVRKPLVFGEFGIGVDGYNGVSQLEWFHAFFESNAREGTAGAMFWILTTDPHRGFGITYSSDRDRQILEEIKRSSEAYPSLAANAPAKELLDPDKHLVPRQIAYSRSTDDPVIKPQVIARQDHALIYRFKPEAATAERFEKIGGGAGYIWGSGVGFLEYTVPVRSDSRRVGRVLVRAHIQPVRPVDALPVDIKTRVTLFVNGTNCGSRLVPFETSNQPIIQEWTINSWGVRIPFARGVPVTVRFVVTADSDWLYGVNISNWPEGYDSHDAKPVEIEVR